VSLRPCPNPTCGASKIGNGRFRHCKACNSFSQMTMRLTRRRLQERYPEEYETLREIVESDIYPQFVEAYSKEAP
jgi:hypothetical protein